VTARPQRFEDLARRHGPRVLGYLARRTEPREDAADLLTETLLVAWRRLDDVPADDAGALAWLLAVARRVGANHRRGRRRADALVDRLREHVAAASPPPDPGALDVRRALAGLGAGDREILTLVAWEGLAVAEAAVVIGVSPESARKRLQRARARLAAALDEDPGAPPRVRGEPVADAL
jgi:RNA polymerase sigma-70 factor (ECF subfamily)